MWCVPQRKVNMTETPLPAGHSVQQMCELVVGIARSLVDSPDQVRVETVTTESETVLRLFVTEDDLGKLIGKQGRTARSLRTIIGAAGNKLRGRYSLDIQANGYLNQ